MTAPPDAPAGATPHGPGAAGPRRSRLRGALLGITVALVAGGYALRWTAPDPEALPTAEPQAPLLETFELRPERLRPRATVSGLLEPRRRVDLFAEVEGRVIEVGARELDHVEAGALLLRMDPTLAEVAVDRARAAIARAESEGVLARANLERNRGLASSDATSRARLDEAENASRLAHASLLEARASLAEAQDRLAKQTVTAPFAGVLRSFPVEVGEYVQPGERVAELLDVERLRITIGLTDRQVVALEPGTRVGIEVDARPGEAVEGEVVRVGGAIDLATRKFPVRIEVDNADGGLLPGMVARMDLALGESRDVMAVPLDAVIDEFGLRHVFVVRPAEGGGHTVAKRRVLADPIPFRPTELELRAGLAEGERIAISSVRQLRDGMAVRPLPPKRGDSLTSREAAR